MARVFSIGNICVDRILRYADELPEWGKEIFFDEFEERLAGQGLNFALAMARLGLETWLVGSLGDDSTGEKALSELEKIKNLNCDLVTLQKDASTGFTVSIVRKDGERMFLSSLGHQALYSLQIERVLQAAEKGDLIHVSGFFMFPNIHREVSKIFKNVAGKGILRSFDPGWDPNGFEKSRSTIFSILDRTDFFEPNELELMGIMKRKSIGSAILEFAKQQDRVLLALKEGAKGSRVFERGKMKARAKIFPIKVVDTTGAGDVFDAGFLYGILKGYSLDDCLKIGNLAASKVISSRKRKGAEAFPIIRELLHSLGLSSEN